jgi:hypothetical protein
MSVSNNILSLRDEGRGWITAGVLPTSCRYATKATGRDGWFSTDIVSLRDGDFIEFVGWDQRVLRAPAHHLAALSMVGRRYAGPTLHRFTRHKFTASERKATIVDYNSCVRHQY